MKNYWCYPVRTFCQTPHAFHVFKWVGSAGVAQFHPDRKSQPELLRTTVASYSTLNILQQIYAMQCESSIQLLV
jgi:hypothetical protein